MSKKLNKFLNGKGFYVALGICMVAIGISAWTAMYQFKNSDGEGVTSPTESAALPSSEEAVDRPQSNVEDTRSTKKTSSADRTSSKKQEVSSVEEAPVAKFFTYPVVGEVIKKFSDTTLQYSVTYNDMRLHTGIDIKANSGTAVKSAGEGIVLFAENDPILGYTVIIDHGNQIKGVYAGLTKAITVKKGQRVSSGTVIGALGTVANECLDAPHLHLEFFKGERAIDPLSLIK